MQQLLMPEEQGPEQVLKESEDPPPVHNFEEWLRLGEPSEGRLLRKELKD
jgi:hypothetical protein